MGSKFLITFASFVIVVAGIRAAESLMTPLLLSAFFAIISAPPLIWMESKHVPTGLAILLVLSVLLGLVFATGALIGTSLNDFTQALPIYQDRLNEETKVFSEWLQRHPHAEEIAEDALKRKKKY